MKSSRKAISISSMVSKKRPLVGVQCKSCEHNCANDCGGGKKERSHISKKKKHISALDPFITTYGGVPTSNAHYKTLWALLTWATDHNENIVRVLYPGSYVHVVPSLVFPRVVYVDNMKGRNNCVPKFFDDSTRPELVTFLSTGKVYKGEPEINFHNVDFTTNTSALMDEEESFDMLLSLSASGTIPDTCNKYLRSGGLLYVNDDFGDACLAMSQPQRWKLVGAFDNTDYSMVKDEDELRARYFIRRRTRAKLELHQLQENSGYSFSKRPHKLEENAFAYVFRKR